MATSLPPLAFVTLRGTRELRFAPFAETVQLPPPGPSFVVDIYDRTVEDLTHWWLDYQDPALAVAFGAPPLVAKVTLLSRVTGACALWLDAALLPDVTYELTTQALQSPYRAIVVGPRRALRPDTTDGTLLYGDIDAPLHRPTGRGGDYTRTGAADFALSGGVATVEKLIWHRLFTPQGALDWAPGYGSHLSLKALAPRDLRAEESRLRALVESVPGLTSATVSVLFEEDHALVRVRAHTTFGELTTERRPS